MKYESQHWCSYHNTVGSGELLGNLLAEEDIHLLAFDLHACFLDKVFRQWHQTGVGGECWTVGIFDLHQAPGVALVDGFEHLPTLGGITIQAAAQRIRVQCAVQLLYLPEFTDGDKRVAGWRAANAGGAVLVGLQAEAIASVKLRFESTEGRFAQISWIDFFNLVSVRLCRPMH